MRKRKYIDPEQYWQTDDTQQSWILQNLESNITERSEMFGMHIMDVSGCHDVYPEWDRIGD